VVVAPGITSQDDPADRQQGRKAIRPMKFFIEYRPSQTVSSPSTRHPCSPGPRRLAASSGRARGRRRPCAWSRSAGRWRGGLTLRSACYLVRGRVGVFGVGTGSLSAIGNIPSSSSYFPEWGRSLPCEPGRQTRNSANPGPVASGGAKAPERVRRPRRSVGWRRPTVAGLFLAAEFGHTSGPGGRQRGPAGRPLSHFLRDAWGGHGGSVTTG
jgi:hypothetical protein